jgi:hypothetical protein
LEIEAQLSRLAPSSATYYDKWTDSQLEERLESLWTDELPTSLQRVQTGDAVNYEWLRAHARNYGWIDLHESRDRLYEPEVDPITLMSLEEHVFEYKISDSATVRYNVSSICEYLLLSGNFVEPTSRKAFTIDDMRQLDKLAKRAKLTLPSLQAAFCSPQKFESKAQAQLMLDGLDRCVGEVVSEMMKCIELCWCAEHGQVLLLELMAQFDFVFAQLKQADSEFAMLCLDQYKSVLRGPPNRPTIDNCGLLSVALAMLSSNYNQ